MNIELEEVVQDVSDDALELAAWSCCLTGNSYGFARVLNLGIKMNIELEEVVVMEVSDDALELAAGGAQGGDNLTVGHSDFFKTPTCIMT